MRPLRWIPEGGALVEIASRTLNSMFLLRCASPFDKPIRIDRSPTGLYHATGQHYAILIEAFKLFVNTYRDAAEKLKAGKLNVRFPPGAFPPPRPIVLASALLAPD